MEGEKFVKTLREKIKEIWLKNGEEPLYNYEIDAILSAVREEIDKMKKLTLNGFGKYDKDEYINLKDMKDKLV